MLASLVPEVRWMEWSRKCNDRSGIGSSGSIPAQRTEVPKRQVRVVRSHTTAASLPLPYSSRAQDDLTTTTDSRCGACSNQEEGEAEDKNKNKLTLHVMQPVLVLGAYRLWWPGRRSGLASCLWRRTTALGSFGGEALLL